MRQYIDTVGLGTGSRACRFFVSYLRDDALTWWRSYSKDSLQVFDQLTLDVLIDEITRHFSDIDCETKLRQKLFTMRQQGSVQGFTTAFNQVQLELGTNRVSDDVAMHLYIMALKPYTQQWVRMQRPQTIGDAMELAERADQTLMLPQRVNPPQQRPNHQFRPQQQQQNRNPNNFRNVSQYSNSRYKGPAPMVLGNADTSKSTCHHCGKQGHFKKDCWKLNGVPSHVKNCPQNSNKNKKLPPPPKN